MGFMSVSVLYKRVYLFEVLPLPKRPLLLAFVLVGLERVEQNIPHFFKTEKSFTDLRALELNREETG